MVLIRLLLVVVVDLCKLGLSRINRAISKDKCFPLHCICDLGRPLFGSS